MALGKLSKSIVFERIYQDVCIKEVDLVSDS